QWERLTARVTGAAIALGQNFLDEMTPVLRAINLATAGAEELAQEFQRLDGEVLRMRGVRAQVDRLIQLTSQTERTAEESDELRRITAELAAAYPEYVRQTDAAGNALSFYTGRLRDATRAEWELYRIQQLRTLGRLVGGIESGRRRAERAARVAGMHFAEFEAQGGFAA